MTKNEPPSLAAARRSVSALRNILDEYVLGDDPSVKAALTTIDRYAENSVSQAEHQLALNRAELAEGQLARFREDMAAVRGRYEELERQLAERPVVRVNGNGDQEWPPEPPSVAAQAEKPKKQTPGRYLSRMKLQREGDPKPVRVRKKKSKAQAQGSDAPKAKKSKNGRSKLDKISDKLFGPPEVPQPDNTTRSPGGD